MKRIIGILFALTLLLNIPVEAFADQDGQYELKLNAVTEVQAKQNGLGTMIYFTPPKTQGYFVKIPTAVKNKYSEPYFIKGNDFTSPIFGETVTATKDYYMITEVLQAGETYRLSLSPQSEADEELKVPVGIYDGLGADAPVMANPQIGSLTAATENAEVQFYQMNVPRKSNYNLTLYCDHAVSGKTKLLLFDENLRVVKPEFAGFIVDKGIEHTYPLDAGKYYVAIKIWPGNQGTKLDYKLALEDLDNQFIIEYKGYMSLHPGQSEVINIKYFPESARPEYFIFESQNPSVAEVDQSGKVTAKSVGKTEIHFKGSDGVGDYKVTVTVTEDGDTSGGNNNNSNQDNNNNNKPDGGDSSQPGGNSNNQSGESANKPDADTSKPEENPRPTVGERVTIGKLKYRVTHSSAKESTNAVTVLGAISKNEKKLVIPDSISIRGYIFKVTKIENNAFRNYKKLQEVSIGRYVEQIGKGAFSGCSKLKDISITSKNLKQVGKDALKGTYKKAKISFRAELEKKYKKILKNKGQNKAVTYAYVVPPKGERYSAGSLSYRITKSSAKKGTAVVEDVTKRKLTSAVIPATVKLGGYTFKVTGIADRAFANCKQLKKVAIGKNVKSIGEQAFANCRKLKNISVNTKNLKKIGKYALKGIYGKCTIEVPSSKYKTYKKLFKNKGQSKNVKVIK